MLERVQACLPQADGDAALVGEVLDGPALRLRRSLAEGQLHFRRQLELLMRSLQACLLSCGEAAVAALHIRRHLMRGYDPEADPAADLGEQVIDVDLSVEATAGV